MATLCTDTVYSPIKFLGATVLSFNGNLGFGSEESTFSVDLVEDCAAGDVFAGGDRDALIGMPVYFPDNAAVMDFGFAGIITNWTVREGSSGLTFTVTLTDPRRVLENAMVIVDTYNGPVSGPNICNVYGFYEGSVANGNCSAFGTSGASERGMPYFAALQGLASLNPVVYTPTGYALYIDYSSIPAAALPQHYRVNGPAISILQLITDVYEAIGYDFYVYLGSNNTIKFGGINLNATPPSFAGLISSLGGQVTERSFGKELRIEKQKTLIFGEKVHYPSISTDFKYYFGEIEGTCEPIIAFPSGTDCGFYIVINTCPLAAAMRYVFPCQYMSLSEIDIRASMGSYQTWKNRVLNTNLPTSYGGVTAFNVAARNFYTTFQIEAKSGQVLQKMGAASVASNRIAKGLPDELNNPDKSDALVNMPFIDEDAQKMFAFVQSIGRTYYGRQFLARLDERICYNSSDNSSSVCATSEKIYSSVPTNDGAWVENGATILDLSDPFLGFFREDDGRVGSFALFNTSGEAPVIVTTSAPTTVAPTTPAPGGGT
jgi:hypothetical protein